VPDPPVYRPLPAAAKRIPSARAGKQMHPSTLTHWIVHGAKLSDGSYLRLEAKRFPAGWMISDEAVERFLDRLTADRMGEQVIVPPKEPVMSAASKRRAAWVDGELDRLGI
jgi:hypothetical protein